jgi:hypothetical protein
MIAKAVATVVLGLIAAAMILVGTSFAGFAIFTALEKPVGVPGAAALTALILLIGPVLFVLAAAIFRPRRRSNEVLIAELFSGLVRDKPLLSMVGAGLVGAAGMFLRRRR